MQSDNGSDSRREDIMRDVDWKAMYEIAAKTAERAEDELYVWKARAELAEAALGLEATDNAVDYSQWDKDTLGAVARAMTVQRDEAFKLIEELKQAQDGTEEGSQS